MASGIDRIADACERMATALGTDDAADRFMTELLASRAASDPKPTPFTAAELADWYLGPDGMPWAGKGDAARPLTGAERDTIEWKEPRA